MDWRKNGASMVFGKIISIIRLNYLSCLLPHPHISSISQPSVISHVMVWPPPADQSFFPPEKILVENYGVVLANGLQLI